MSSTFNQVGASLYIREIHELLDACLFHLGRLAKAQGEWQAHVAEADRTIGIDRPPEDSGKFNEALHRQGRSQSEVFDCIEAFLAAWARLSLMFSPVPRRSAPNRTFTDERGAILRELFVIEATHPILDRDLRDSWMHADERLDAAWLEHRLGDRQRFVKTSEVARSVSQSPRVIDVETLTVHYRDASGASRAQHLPTLGDVLSDLVARENEAHARVRKLPLNQH